MEFIILVCSTGKHKNNLVHSAVKIQVYCQRKQTTVDFGYSGHCLIGAVSYLEPNVKNNPKVSLTLLRIIDITALSGFV